MVKRIDGLPVVLTSFAYRDEYIAEMEGMLATVRAHHPDWPLVIGRGPVAGCNRPTLEVESPAGTCQWSLPVPLNFDGSENDWRKGTMMKAWWIAQVWRHFGGLVDVGRHRVLWTDADSRFNGPLDIELDPEAEVVAGAWWDDPEDAKVDTICSGTLLLQGARRGKVATLLDQWASNCLSYIERMADSTSPLPDSDQEALTEVLKSHPETRGDYVLLKLDLTKYSATPFDDCKLAPGGLVDHWGMVFKMRRPQDRGRNWPPPEDYRHSAVGTAFPNINWERPGDDPADQTE